MRYLAVESLMSASPVDWPWLPLRRVMTLRRERNTQSEAILLAVSSERSVEPRPDDGGRQLPAESTIADYWLVKPGDIVFNPMWAIGGGVAASSISGAVSPAYRVYTPGPKIFPRFAHYYLRCSKVIEQYSLVVRGLTTFDRSVTREDFEMLPVPTPHLAVQCAIADYLDRETARIDALITKKQRMVALIEQRWRSESTYCVLHGLNPITGEGTMPEGWKVVHLGVLLALHRGFDLPADSRLDGPIPVISSGGISGSHYEKACDGPGVVTGRYGTIGEAFFVEGPYWPLNTTLFVSEFRGNDAKWVYYLLSTMPLDIDSAKSAVTGINRNVIGTLWASRPPLECQNHIAKHLDAKHRIVDRLLNLIRCQIELLRERRQALITAAVTGELKIPVPGVVV